MRLKFLSSAAHRVIKRLHGAASLLADVRDPLLAFGAAREAARVIPSCDGAMPRGLPQLIAAQCGAALADNALLIVGIALLQAQGQPGWLAPMLKFCATLSYVLLAPFVGPLADAVPKARLMAWMNALKLLALLGLMAGAPALACFGLLGC